MHITMRSNILKRSFLTRIIGKKNFIKYCNKKAFSQIYCLNGFKSYTPNNSCVSKSFLS